MSIDSQISGSASTRLVVVTLLPVLLAMMGASQAGPAEAGLVRVQDHIFYLDIARHHNKVVIAEFDDFVAIVESPHDDGVALEILDACAQAFPDKPVKYLFHSHHHSHSIAGVDPYLARSVTIVTSPRNLETINGKTTDTSALARSAVLIDSVFTLQDRVNELTVHLIRRSQDRYPLPTEEFMVTYFPRQRVLVSGCLYNKPLDSLGIIDQRKPALRRFIADRDLDVNYLVPTNSDSLAGFENVCTVEMLERTLAEGVDPDSMSIGLQRLGIEYIECRRDSLIEFFETRHLRSHDLQVLIDCLYGKYEDPHRGIQLAKIAAAILPDNFRVYRMIGTGYRLKKDYIEALVFYEKSRALALLQSNERLAAVITKDIEQTRIEMESWSRR